MLASATGKEGQPMKMLGFHWGGAVTAAVLALLTAEALQAADQTGVRPVAEELGQRAAPPETQQKSGMSDNAVRVLMTYAFSIIPETQNGPDGKPVKIDKTDPNVFLIPVEDARRVIRAATRSAYAEACQLENLARANYQAMMQSEMAKKVWSEPQLLMINALHMFSASYFSGDAKITEVPENGATEAAKGDNQPSGVDLVVPKRPQCPPEQKQKVENAINAYVQAQAPSATQGAAAPR
jgi:hypothetical protein